MVYVENKTLYFRREQVPTIPRVPVGSARIVRPGRDVTVVALSRLVHEALEAADELADDGIEVEVIDPRSLVPLDLETIVESVSRTHRLVVAHEAVEHGGFGAEIAAQVQAAGSTSSTRRSSVSALRSRPFRSARRSRTRTFPAAGRGRGGRAGSCLHRRGSLGSLVVSILGNRVLRRRTRGSSGARATYVENLPLEGARTVTFVRSPFAHARITGIDASAAAEARRTSRSYRRRLRRV